MKLEERMAAIEHAHRVLAARHEALFQICKVMLPIALSPNAKMVSRLLTSCYDITSDHMDKHGMDDEYQEMVRAEMDELAKILILVDTPSHRPR